MEDNRTYCVYIHKVVTDDRGPLWYVGVTKQKLYKRWQPSFYKKHNSLWPYIQEYGWDNIEHRVVSEGLDREMALKLEDTLIRMYRSADCCINKNRSGLIKATDTKAYRKQYGKQYYEDHREDMKAYAKQYNEAHREEIRAYNKQWCEDHREERKAYNKQYNKARSSTSEGKIYNRVNAFNQRHPDRAIETPLEAKLKYLETGYIPAYIKNDDILKYIIMKDIFI